MKNRLITLTTFLLFNVFAWAMQDPAQTPVQSTTRSGSRRPPTPSTGFDSSGRVIRLNGKLVMADGSPLPKFVQVDLSCLGKLTWQTHASGSGHFSFELAANRQAGMALSDASVSNPGLDSLGGVASGQPGGASGRRASQNMAMGQLDLTGCEILVKSVPGYWAEPIELGLAGGFDGNIGNVYLNPLAGVTGKTVSSKTLLAPRSAVKEYESAKREMARKSPNLAKAAKELQKALQAYPDFAEAWHLLGELRYKEKDFPRAREACRTSIRIDPRYIYPFLLLAQVELSDNRWAEAVRWSDRVVELNPYLPLGRYLHALAHFQQNDFTVAEKSILMLRSGSQVLPWLFVHYMMGTMLAQRGEYAAAAGELLRYLEGPLPPSAVPVAEQAKLQLADWERRGWITVPQKAILARANEPRK